MIALKKAKVATKAAPPIIWSLIARFMKQSTSSLRPLR